VAISDGGDDAAGDDAGDPAVAVSIGGMSATKIWSGRKVSCRWMNRENSDIGDEM